MSEFGKGPSSPSRLGMTAALSVMSTSPSSSLPRHSSFQQTSNIQHRTSSASIENPESSIANRGATRGIQLGLSIGIGNRRCLTGRGGKAQPRDMNVLNRYVDPVDCILRLVIGLMFACHGGQKLLGFPPGGQGAGEGIMLLGAWIELVGGFLVAFGLLTRIEIGRAHV